MTKAECLDKIRAAISSNSAAALKALDILYRYQTTEEKVKDVTLEDNGVGFNSRDAGFCTSLWKQRYRGSRLSDRQLAVLRRILAKYAGQIFADAVARGLYVKREKGGYEFLR